MQKEVLYKNKWFAFGLLILLGLRISSYFTLFPNSVAMTQLVKTVLRVLLTGIAFLGLYQLKNKFPKYRTNYHNIIPLLLYGGYLFLGLSLIHISEPTRPY